MATRASKVLHHLHHFLSAPDAERTDGEFLARFLASRDEASFAALVRRHGPMVLGVCRRMLRHAQDAEDCFQATFLVLARKAATVKRDALASWLYAVAYRTSLEARAINARRRARERQVDAMPHPEVLPPETQDWRPWLDQELNRLPEKYRSVIVACDLEGRSRKEAARLLGLSEGTLSSRLARGRCLLAKRLAPYGLSLPAAALATALGETAASAQVPAVLIASTTKAALLVAAGELTAVSAASATLMKGVLKSMFLTRLKLMVGALMIVTALGASGLVYRATGQAPTPTEKRSDGKPRSELERLRHENELLKLNLEIVLEKLHAQEAELRGLRAESKSAAKSPSGGLRYLLTTPAPNFSVVPNVFLDLQANTGKLYVVPSPQVPLVRDTSGRMETDPLCEAEAALKALREAKDAEAKRKAADALDKAMKKYREKLKQPESNKPR